MSSISNQQNQNINESAQKDMLKKESISVKRDNVVKLSLTYGQKAEIPIEKGVIWYEDIRPFQDRLIEAVIPDGVTTINDHAFRDCHRLTNVEIPDSVKKIGMCAFWNCSNLANVRIPDGVTKIGEFTFSGCRSLTYAKLPKSVQIIDNNAFWSCTSLRRVDIPDSVEEIGNQAFEHCKSLKRIVIPYSVERICSYYIFYGCESLREIWLPITLKGAIRGYKVNYYRKKHYEEVVNRVKENEAMDESILKKRREINQLESQIGSNERYNEYFESDCLK